MTLNTHYQKKDSRKVILIIFAIIILFFILINATSVMISFFSYDPSWDNAYSIRGIIIFLLSNLFSFIMISSLLFAISLFIFVANWNKHKNWHMNLMTISITSIIFYFVFYVFVISWDTIQTSWIADLQKIGLALISIIVPILTFISLTMINKEISFNWKIALFASLFSLMYFIIMIIIADFSEIIVLNFYGENRYWLHSIKINGLGHWWMHAGLIHGWENSILVFLGNIIIAVFLSSLHFGISMLFKLIFQIKTKK